jgi:hypothetical protein
MSTATAGSSNPTYRGVVKALEFSNSQTFEPSNSQTFELSSYQNLWKRADTKAAQPVFKASFDRTVELGEKGDADNTVKLTFKKDGAVAFAGKVKGTKVSGSSQLVNDGKGWSVTLYAPPKAPFDGWCETFAVTLTTDEDTHVVTGVTVATAAAEELPDPPAWGVGEYVGYGYFDGTGHIADYLYGMVYIELNEDFSFTGRFCPVDGTEDSDFSGKMYCERVTEDIYGYNATNVAINVDGNVMPMDFQFILMGCGKMDGLSEADHVPGIFFFDILHNIWSRDDFPEARPTFASGTTKVIELKDHPGIYSLAGKPYLEGETLTFSFGEGGKISVTGAIFGVPVNTTATIGVNTIIEDGAKLDCHITFEANGRIYQLMVEVPSSGEVTAEEIVLPGEPSSYFGLING